VVRCYKVRAARTGAKAKQEILVSELVMVNETKSLRTQAERAERAARAATDPEISQDFSVLAKAYRSQADVLKQKKQQQKKKQEPLQPKQSEPGVTKSPRS
jgi:hypothetical protein